MTDYERNPTMPSLMGDISARLNAVERRTYGTLTYYDNATTTTVGTSQTSLWSDTLVVPDESVVEFCGYVEINHTVSGATTDVSLFIDGVKTTQWARYTSASTGGARVSTIPGDPYGAQLSSYPGGFIVAALVAANNTGSCWGIDAGEHTIEVKAAKSGAGTSRIVDRAFAVRAS